jgi:hypothetical protein
MDGGRCSCLAASQRAFVDRRRSLPVFATGHDPRRPLGERQVGRRPNRDSEAGSAITNADVDGHRGRGRSDWHRACDFDPQLRATDASASRSRRGEDGRASPGCSNPSAYCEHRSFHLGGPRGVRASAEAGGGTASCSLRAAARACRRGSSATSNTGTRATDAKTCTCSEACPRAGCSVARRIPSAETAPPTKAGDTDDCSRRAVLSFTCAWPAGDDRSRAKAP